MIEKTELTNEFHQRFGNVLSRVIMFQKTQPNIIKNYTSLITLPVSESVKSHLACGYLLLLTEELVEIPIDTFAKDLLVFADERNLEFSLFDHVSLEDFVQDILEPFFTILLLISDTMQETLKRLIVDMAQEFPLEIIQMMVLQHFIQPLFQKILLIMSKNGTDTDLRFVAAIISNYILTFVDRKFKLAGKTRKEDLPIQSIKSTYESFKEEYPLSSGEDLYFDICWKLILKKTWNRIIELVSNEIDNLKQTIEAQKADIKAQYQSDAKRESSAYSDDFYLSIVGMKLMEVFDLNKELDDRIEKGIVNAVDVMIRRYSIDKIGYISSNAEEMVTIGIDLLWESIWDNPQLLTPILEPKELMTLMKMETSEEARKWVKENAKVLKERFGRMITQGAGMQPSPSFVGEAFVNLVKKAKNSKITLSF